MIVIESTGRKLKDAIDSGLQKLNKTLMDVDVEVLDNGGLFRKAKVRITVKGEDEGEAIKETKKVEKPNVPEVREVRSDEKREPKKPEREPRLEQRETPKDNVRKQNREKESKREEPLKSSKENEEGKESRRNVPITEEAAAEAERLAKEIIAKMGIETEVTSSIVSGGVVIEIQSHSSELIGYHGEVLDAIEYILSCAINKDETKFYRVVVDCDNYRAKRRDNLVALANKMAAKCLKVRHKIELEPMSSNERRIIHATLATNDKIITKSEGHEPNRRVVIFCKRR